MRINLANTGKVLAYLGVVNNSTFKACWGSGQLRPGLAADRSSAYPSYTSLRKRP
jgi:hypothetical protein